MTLARAVGDIRAAEVTKLPLSKLADGEKVN